MENASRVERRDSLALSNGGWLPVGAHGVHYVEGKPKLRRILVVDDEKGVRDAMAGLLGDFGYQVAVAADAAEALTLLKESNFGLVLTDLNMPGMDGWSLAGRIKKDSSTPVVLITGADKRSVEARLKDSAVDSVLFKPFRVEDLVAVVIESFPANT